MSKPLPWWAPAHLIDGKADKGETVRGLCGKVFRQRTQDQPRRRRVCATCVALLRDDYRSLADYAEDMRARMIVMSVVTDRAAEFEVHGPNDDGEVYVSGRMARTSMTALVRPQLQGGDREETASERARRVVEESEALLCGCNRADEADDPHRHTIREGCPGYDPVLHGNGLGPSPSTDAAVKTFVADNYETVETNPGRLT